MSHQEDSDKSKADLLNLTRRKAANRPFFLAAALEIFCQLEQLDQAGLAAYLKLEPGQLDLLGLCRRPDSTTPAAFQRDIRLICERFGIAPLQLARLLRRVAAYEALQAAPPTLNNFLMAARDYEEEPDE